MLSLEAVCNGDLDRAMKFVVFDHRRSGKHKIMGEFETNMGRILDRANTDVVNFFMLRRHDEDVGKIIIKADLQRPEKLRNQSKQKRRESKTKSKPPPQDMPPSPSGGIPQSISVAPRPDFLDYLGGGCEISLAVAIDFTASNGTFLILYSFARCVLWKLCAHLLIRQEILEYPALLTTFIRRPRKSLMITKRQSTPWDRFWQSLTRITCFQSGDLGRNLGIQYGTAFSAGMRWKCIVSTESLMRIEECLRHRSL
jgi:hypothetical protein